MSSLHSRSELDLSLVIPVYNEEESLEELLRRTVAMASGLGRSWELILVNDGSRDRSLEILEAAASENPHLVVIDFNRNYGQHAAVFAGFEAARGGVIVTLDADLQNPPEEVPKLVAEIDRGFDVVGSVRENRRDSLFRRLASRWINRMTARTTGVELSDYGCMLRAYRREVVENVCRSGEISTFIPVLADMFAGRVTEVPVAHAPRAHGESKYSLWKLIRLQFDLMTSFTLLPLRGTMALGVVMALLAFLVALVLIGGRLIYGSEWAVSGVFTLFALIFVFIGGLLFAIGLLGEYVGRIYLEVRHRPRFVIRRIIGGEGER